MIDRSTVLIGGVCFLGGLGVWLFWFSNMRKGTPIAIGQSRNNGPALNMSATHAALASLFFFGIGSGLMGSGSGSGFGRWGLATAILAFIVLIVTVIMQSIVLDRRHKKAMIEQGLMEPAKKMSAWLYVPIWVALGGFCYFIYHAVQKREAAMESVVTQFAEAARAGDYEAAWQLYTDEAKADYPLATFQRSMPSTGFAQVTGLEQTALESPYKMSPGVAEYQGRDEHGNLQRYSLVFTQYGSIWEMIREPKFRIHRFTHDSPKIFEGVQQFVRWLKSGNLKSARSMAYIHERDAEGNLLYTLDGKQLLDLAQSVGLLSARKLGFMEPVWGDHGQITMEVLVTPPKGQPWIVELRLGYSQRSLGPSDGVRIYGIERKRE